jgi:hypothetical protein
MATQKVLIVLLILAIVFSIASVILTISLNDFDSAKFKSPSQSPDVISGSGGGGVGLLVEPQPNGSSP